MRFGRVGAAAFVALFLAAVPALPAVAHAQLIESSPTDGSTVPTSPAEVAVAFNEPVTAPAAAIRVYDTTGARVDPGTVESTDGGARLVATPDRELVDGTYIATWRAVSADGHPISGAFVFHVGQPGASVDDSVIATLLGTSGGRAVGFFSGLLRWVVYLSSLAVIGVFVFAATLDPSIQERARWLIWVAARVGIVASVFQIPLFAMTSTGLGFEALGSGQVWADAITSSVGVAALVRAFGLALMLWATARWMIWLGWVAVTTLIVAELVTGHTRTTDPAWLVLPADAIHVVAAGIWLGGLGALMMVTLSRRREDDPVAAADAVARFSRLAAWTVLALTLAGGALAWSQVRAARALTSTAYGWTLLAKVGLVIGVLGIALYNNRVLVPRVSGEDRESAWQRLGKTVRIEVLGLVMVVGITALLVNLPPAAEAAGVFGLASVYVDLGDRQLNVVVDPNRAGLNVIHATVFSPGGLSGLFDGPVTFEFEMPAEQIGPIVRQPVVAGPNHVIHTGSELAVPGDWEITVRERISDFEEQVAVVQVTVNR